MSAAPRTDPVATRMAGLVAPVVEAAGYDLEELVVTPAGRRSIVRVVVDRDAGVTLDHVAEVSRAASAALDEHDGEFGSAPYVLEVTSPGVDRPLTEPRHWRRNTGRLVTVGVGVEGSAEQVTARVLKVHGDGVPLAVEAKGEPGAKKRPPSRRHVPWQELGAGRVQVGCGRSDPGGDTSTEQADPADDDGGGQ